MKLSVFALLCAAACTRTPTMPVTTTNALSLAKVPAEEPPLAKVNTRPDGAALFEHDAAETFRGMRADFLRCFAFSGESRASIRVEVLVGAAGDVRTVAATNERTLARSTCIENRIARATFTSAPNGTTRVTVPLFFALEDKRTDPP